MCSSDEVLFGIFCCAHIGECTLSFCWMNPIYLRQNACLSVTSLNDHFRSPSSKYNTEF